MTETAHGHESGEEGFSEHGVQRRLGGLALKVLVAIALAFSTYQLVVAAFHPLSSIVIRSLHVGFLLTLTFILYPFAKHGQRHDESQSWRYGTGDSEFPAIDLPLGVRSRTDRALGRPRTRWTSSSARRSSCCSSRRRGASWAGRCRSSAARSCSSACSASTCRVTSRTAATATTRSSVSWRWAPKASWASRRWSRPPTFSCSSCSAPSSNTPA